MQRTEVSEEESEEEEKKKRKEQENRRTITSYSYELRITRTCRMSHVGWLRKREEEEYKGVKMSAFRNVRTSEYQEEHFRGFSGRIREWIQGFWGFRGDFEVNFRYKASTMTK